MRVLIICHEHPPLGGGGGNAARKIAGHLAQDFGDEVVFLTAHYAGLPLEERTDGYRIVRVDIGRARTDGSSVLEWIRFARRALNRAGELVAAGRPDVCLAFFSLPAGYVAGKLQKSYNIPYVVSLRGADVPGFLPSQLSLYHALLKPLTANLWRGAERVVANCSSLLRLAQHTTRSARFSLVLNGFDPQTFHPGDPTHTVASPVRLLFIGRLEHQKGLEYLLTALAGVRGAFALRIVGDGSLKAGLERRAAESGLKGRVEFAGWVPRQELPALYREADIFVLPSLDEGMPQALMEAMASGLAVVATDVGGTGDIVRSGVNGVLVPARDAARLKETLEDLIGSPEKRAAFGAKARETALAHTWKEVAAQYRELLRPDRSNA